MGSDSDLPTMRAAAEVLRDFGIAAEVTVVSAHRTPERMLDYARSAHSRGIKVRHCSFRPCTFDIPAGVVQDIPLTRLHRRRGHHVAVLKRIAVQVLELFRRRSQNKLVRAKIEDTYKMEQEHFAMAGNPALLQSFRMLSGVEAEGSAMNDCGWYSAQVIIAGAGGAAHLPGMVAALTPLPVIGVPVKPAGAHLDGLDALLSIVQVC